MISNLPSANQGPALVKLNVQHNLSVLNADPSIAKANVSVYGAIYDVNNGLINFLSGSDLTLPSPDPIQPLGWGTYMTQNFKSGAQTSVTQTVSLSKTYSTPPRIFPGIFGLELHYGTGRINFSSTFGNVTKTGFDFTATSTDGCTFNQSDFNWIEIPDELAYASVQTGIWSTQPNFPTGVANQCLLYQVTFPVPYASIPNVVAVPLGFDIEHPTVAVSLEVSSSQVTTTGFLITISMTPGQQLRSGSVSWMAYPKDSKLGIATGPIGNSTIFTAGQNISGTAQLPSPIASGQACYALLRIYKFTINPSDYIRIWSNVDEPRTVTAFNYTLGNGDGLLKTVDASYLAWNPAP
jgi:hypothetical protein